MSSPPHRFPNRLTLRYTVINIFYRGSKTYYTNPIECGRTKTPPSILIIINNESNWIASKIDKAIAVNNDFKMAKTVWVIYKNKYIK